MPFHYQHSLPLDHIALVTPTQLRDKIVSRVAQGWQVVCLCALPLSALQATDSPAAQNTAESPQDASAVACLLCVLAHDATGMLLALRTAALTAYPSLTPVCPQVHLFEREIYEQWKILPKGHPWLKPVRYCPPFPEATLPPTLPSSPANPSPRPLPGITDYFTVQGPEVHEVAVGPVHAGVIEPGHFRFQCYGENVLHLEISLGFQHRGIERQLLGGPDARTVYMMECLAGDSTIAHTTALCLLLENLTACPATPRGQALRRVALELERLANHTGDLGALAGDVGFLPTLSWCGRIRGDFLNMTALLCGNRFGRGLVRRGGVMQDVDDSLIAEVLTRLKAAHRDVRGAVDTMFETSSVLNRFEDTGVISTATARELGLVGVPARASGLLRDARAFYPPKKPAADLSPSPPLLDKARIPTCTSGDVYARARIRSEEIDQSVASIEAELRNLPQGAAIHDEIRTLPQQRLAVAFVEGWRGTLCHVGITGPEGLFAVYKVFDPSFHNWMGLAMALRDEQISDFPLCNKSFNLSYCGHDL